MLYQLALSMNSRSRDRAPIAALEAKAGPSESDDSGKENELGPHWMTALGPKNGPLCTMCDKMPATRHHQEYGMICISCKRMIESNLLSWYWGMLGGPNNIMVNREIMRLIADFIWGEGAYTFCYCGLCEDGWLVKGWVCYGD